MAASAYFCKSLTRPLLVQLRIVSKNAFLVESYAPVGLKIRCQARASGDAIMQGDESWILGF
jgi:hypothetical protein